MRLLVTGGAGYIGSHTCVELLQAAHDVTVIDNLSNSSQRSLDAVRRIANREPAFLRGDLLDRQCLDELFRREPFDAVLHFAGLKAVGESVSQPLAYYRNNLVGSMNLVEAMSKHGVKRLVFSSSATVYGNAQRVPLAEDTPLEATNPYGRTKLLIETMLSDLAAADRGWSISMLRYFNPVGAHASGELGEDPNGIPNNLMPYVSQVAVGRLPFVRVFGNDYATPDGTGVRDYIHVVDLARGHLAALDHVSHTTGISAHNLGTGRGYSVLEVIGAFERASGRSIPYRVVERRPGDVAVSYADPARAQADLAWQAEHDIEAMCRDAFHWQSKHPTGFKDGDLR